MMDNHSHPPVSQAALDWTRRGETQFCCGAGKIGGEQRENKGFYHGKTMGKPWENSDLT